jgi:hypothetical protein
MAAVAAILIAAAAAKAQGGGSSSCLPGVTPAPPTFPLISTTGVVSDYTLFCTNTGFVSGPIASMNFDFFMNVTVLNTGGWTLTQGLNTYSGTFTPGNLVAFAGVAYDTNQPTLSFEIHGVKVNPSLWGPSFQYLEDFAESGPLSITFIGNPIQTVAFNANAPEPSTVSLAAMALGVVVLARRRTAPSRSRFV